MAGRDRQLSLLDLPDELLGLVLSHARSDCLDGHPRGRVSWCGSQLPISAGMCCTR